MSDHFSTGDLICSSRSNLGINLIRQKFNRSRAVNWFKIDTLSIRHRKVKPKANEGNKSGKKNKNVNKI